MFKLKFFIFSLACVGLFLTSCEDDLGGGTGGGGTANAPFVSLVDGLDVLSFDAVVAPGETFRVRLDATSNASELNSVEILRNGFGLTRDEFDNENIEDNDEQNPQRLFGTDRDGFTWTFSTDAPEAEGVYEYSFDVIDADMEVSTASITITVELPLVVDNPSVTVATNPVIIAPANSLVSVNVTGVKGTLDLASITVLENNEIVDESRLDYNTVDFASNPLPLFSPDTEGFTSNVTIRTTSGTNTYIIRVADTADNVAEFTFDIEEEMNTTPLEDEFLQVLVSNASGPDLGGLDLSAGAAVSSSNMMANIRDLGIDLGLPNATNWLQQIEPVNGARLSVVNLTNLPENFSYTSVSSKEEIEAAFNTGAEVTISPALQVGDLLTAAVDGTFYLMQLDDVVVTTNDNQDRYEFSIKF